MVRGYDVDLVSILRIHAEFCVVLAGILGLIIIFITSESCCSSLTRNFDMQEKNVKSDEVDGKVGRVYMPKQDVDSIVLSKPKVRVQKNCASTEAVCNLYRTLEVRQKFDSHNGM